MTEDEIQQESDRRAADVTMALSPSIAPLIQTTSKYGPIPVLIGVAGIFRKFAERLPERPLKKVCTQAAIEMDAVVGSLKAFERDLARDRNV